MKTKNIILLVLLSYAGLTHAQTSPDDCWGYVNTLQDEWLRKICTVGLDTVYIVGENGLIARSTDRGETWDKQYVGTAHLNDVKFIDPRTGFAVGEGGAILKTADAGETWTQQTSGTTENINALAFTDLDNLWAVGAKSLVLHSTDGGVTWEKKDIVDVECTLNDIAFQGSLGCFVGDRSIVYITENKGELWLKQKVVVSEYEKFQFLDITENRVYVSCNSDFLYYAGEKIIWNMINIVFASGNMITDYKDLHFVNDSTGYCLAMLPIPTNGSLSVPCAAIYKTEDYGCNWNFIDRFENVSEYYCFDINLVNKTIGYALLGGKLAKIPYKKRPVLVEDINSDDIVLIDKASFLFVKSLAKSIRSLEILDISGKKRVFLNARDVSEVTVPIDIFMDDAVYVIKCTFSDQSNAIVKWINH